MPVISNATTSSQGLLSEPITLCQAYWKALFTLRLKSRCTTSRISISACVLKHAVFLPLPFTLLLSALCTAAQLVHGQTRAEALHIQFCPKLTP